MACGWKFCLGLTEISSMRILVLFKFRALGESRISFFGCLQRRKFFYLTSVLLNAKIVKPALNGKRSGLICWVTNVLSTMLLNESYMHKQWSGEIWWKIVENGENEISVQTKIKVSIVCHSNHRYCPQRLLLVISQFPECKWWAVSDCERICLSQCLGKAGKEKKASFLTRLSHSLGPWRSLNWWNDWER